jgi:hypothetical protein
MLAAVACPDIEHGELMWHYLDDRRIDFGPYTETQMRKRWIEGERFHPDTMVRIISVEHHVKLHDIYPMGNPPTWKPTTSLSRLRRGPEYNVAAPLLGESSAAAAGAAHIDVSQVRAAEAIKEKDEEVLCPSEEPTLTCDEDFNKTPPPREDADNEEADYGEAKEDRAISEEESELPEPQSAPCARSCSRRSVRRRVRGGALCQHLQEHRMSDEEHPANSTN